MSSRFLYIEADTFIHRLHPNTKLLLLVLIFAAVLAFNHPAHEAGFLVLSLVLLAAAGAMGNLLRSWRFFTGILVISALLWVLFVKGIANPTIVWRMKPFLVERGSSEYDMVIIILMTGMLVLAIALLSLVQLVIRDVHKTTGRPGWYVALALMVLAGLALLWKSSGLVPRAWQWYTLLGIYFILATLVALARMKSSYALATWLALVFATVAMYYAVDGFLVHLHLPGPMFRWGPQIEISREALLYGPAMGLRIVAFLSFGLLFISTTSPEQLTQGLRAMGMPITPSVALSLAFRLVPTFAQTARTVIDAQRSRGLDLDCGGPVGRLRRTMPVIVPTLAYALRSADDLTRALETRGLGSGAARTEYRKLPSGVADGVSVAIVLVFTAACVVSRVWLDFGELLPRL